MRTTVPRSSLLVAIAALALVACSEKAERAEPAERTEPAEQVEPVERPEMPDSVAAPAAAVGGWAVSAQGIGAIRAGTTIADAAGAVNGGLSMPHGAAPNGCAYLTWPSAPPGVRLMADAGRIVRVDVSGTETATADGARVGDSEARIDSLYRGRIAVSPAKYDPAGHYLTVMPREAADSAYRIVFETDGRVVTKYRAGIRPAVEYVEGCG